MSCALHLHTQSVLLRLQEHKRMPKGLAGQKLVKSTIPEDSSAAHSQSPIHYHEFSMYVTKKSSNMFLPQECQAPPDVPCHLPTMKFSMRPGT